LRGALEEFVDEGLIGLGLFGGEAAKLGEETRSDADGNEKKARRDFSLRRPILS